MKIELYLLEYPNNKFTVNAIKDLNELDKVYTQEAIKILLISNKVDRTTSIIQYAQKHNPKMVVKVLDTNQELVYDYVNGYVGEQLQLKV